MEGYKIQNSYQLSPVGNPNDSICLTTYTLILFKHTHKHTNRM